MLSALAELDTDGRFRKSEQQRILIEVLLLKFAMLDRTVELEDVIQAVRGQQPARGNPRPSGDPAPSRSREASRREAKPGGESRKRSTTAAEGSPDDIQTAWQEMIAAGKVLRPGQGIALRAAQIVGLSPDGKLRIAATAGTPSAEVLEDIVTRRRIEEELSKRVGRPIRIESEGENGPLPPRVSQETARKQRLDKLVERDQGLQQLVDELDLELMD